MLFDVTLLRSFQAVAQEASFTKAAERLNLTQSAVSSHVRRLEEQAAKSLFVRNTRSVALTGESAIADLMNEIVRAALRRRTRNRHT
jgi:DNA-binding transcriptional LysR family regulator